MTKEGDKYEGEWANDVPNGRGITTLPDGEYIEGIYKEGEVEGDAI